MQKQSDYSGSAFHRIPSATIMIRISKTVVEKQEPLSMKSLARSQSARRRAAATAAFASVGAGILGTHSAEAAIVTIDIGPSGFNIEGPNGGVTYGGAAPVPDFPTSGQGFILANGVNSLWGLFSSGPLQFAAGVNPATPTNFLYNDTIGSSANWTAGYAPLFRAAFYVSPNFGTGSYMGFKTAEGYYGWLEVTWNSSTPQFEILGAAYESDVGTSIVAGDTGSVAIPEIDPNGLASALSLVMGSAAMLEQRRRKRAAVAAAAVTA